MPLSETIERINREIGATVERTLAELRRDVTQRLRTGSEEALRRIEEFTPELPRFDASELLTPARQELREELKRELREELSEELGGAARRSGFGELREALVAIDGARSQADILNALLDRSGAFASRAVVLLVRAGEARGWGARGFGGGEGAVRGVALPLSAEPADAWRRLAEGGGPERLDPAERDALSRRLEAAAPEEALLIPLVLRDRIAAVVYADRAEGARLAADALQALVYTAALAIETLPFRERARTATLAALAAEPEPAPEAEPSLEETAPGLEMEPSGEAAQPVEAAPAYPIEADAPAATPDEIDTETAYEIEAEPELEPATGFELEADQGAAAVEETPPEVAESSATVLIPRPAMPERVEDVPAAPPPPLRPVDDAPAPTAESSTLEGLRAPATGAGIPEVKPPTGVDGPGWAFSTTRVPVSPSDEAIHDEARRLARLLVSEIKLYNEEQVEEGRRNRDVYERLKEDIDRSRQMYEERVDPRVLESTDYFYQELVRILAAGDSKALGI
jgi:hypothetical protein